MVCAFIFAPAVSGDVGLVAISVSPAEIDFGSILPGRDVKGANLTVTNTGSAAVTVTAVITDDASGFYTAGLYLGGVTAAAWSATIASGTSIPVSPQLIGVPSNVSPGSYSCTVIFWAEATP